MKRFVSILLVLALLSVPACTKESTPPDTAPKPSETGSPDGSTVPADGEKTDQPTAPTEPSVPADKFLLEIKELSLKIELPISWKDRMEIVKDGAMVALVPPPEDYNVPDELAYIYMAYIDKTNVYGHSFEEVTQEKTLNNMFIVSENDKIIEKSPMKMIGKNALAVTYSTVFKDVTQVYRTYLIDAEKGRFYIIRYIVEKEGLDGLATFASEADEAVKSLTYYQTAPAVIIYEEKEKGFTLEVPGDKALSYLGEPEEVHRSYLIDDEDMT